MASYKIENSEATNEVKERSEPGSVDWETKFKNKNNKQGNVSEQKESGASCHCFCPDKEEYRPYRELQNHEKINHYTHLISKYLHDCNLSSKNDKIKRILSAFSYEENHLLPHYKWHKDTEHFGCLINDIYLLLQASIDENSCYYKSPEIWNIIQHTLEKVTSALPNKPKPYTFPWGQNWYQFSITYPRFVVFATLLYRHLFDVEHERTHDYLKSVVLTYLPTPMHSIGWKRGGPNSIMMAVSYVGAHLYLGDLDTETSEMKYVLDWLNFKPVTKGEGLYHDGGFIFHTNLRAYGYMYSSLNDMRLLMTYFNIDCVPLLNSLPTILEHPTISMHFGPLFSRTSRLRSSMCGGAYGFYSVDSIKLLSCKTEKWMLQFHGQHKEWCFYEADKSNSSWSQYWVMARQFYYKDMDADLHVIQKEFRTYYPGIISYGNRAIDIKSTRATTETFQCKWGKCITVKLPGLKEAAAIYNSWYISQFNLSVTELMLITHDGYSVIYKINPENNDISSPTEPIVVSVNFGKYDLNKPNSSSKQEPRINNKIYTFQQNNSIIHLGRNEKIFDCKRDAGNRVFHCLQCEPNADNLVAFSTFHSDQSKISIIEENKIVLPPYTLLYNSDMLWLYDAESSKVSIAQYTEYPLSELSFDQTLITSALGSEVEIQNGSLKESYVTSTNYKRNYGVFINVDDQKFKNFIENL